MRISPIISNNFKGIWGKTYQIVTSAKTYHDGVNRSHRIVETTRNYYAFKDETQDEIQETIKPHVSYNPFEIEVKKVNIRTLPITKADWEAFLKVSDFKYNTSYSTRETIERNEEMHSTGGTSCSMIETVVVNLPYDEWEQAAQQIRKENNI